MAASLLIVVVLIFALRGLFLGLGGVIGKISGFILGYFISYTYGTQLAQVLKHNTSINLPSIALEMISGVLLFLVTSIATGLIINALFRLLAKVIPALRFLTDKQSMPGKISGATVNAALGAVLMLVAIALYDQIRQQPSDDPLHKIAHNVGGQLFAFVSKNSNITINTFSQFTSKSTQSSRPSSSQKNTPINSSSSQIGRAEIVSTQDPNKRLSIESTQKVIEQITANGGAIDNGQLQELLGNSDIRAMAENYLNDNPEQLQTILQNPELLKLIEQLQQK